MSNLSIELTQLPLILAGPILRHTTPESVTVWVAVQTACRVELRIFATEDNGAQIGNILLRGSRQTIALGEHLHIVAVTADRGEKLTIDRIYAYDLTFIHSDGSIEHTLAQALSAPNSVPPNLSYFAHQYPTLILPPDRIADLRIVHGSCRKPHGDGHDALPLLDSLLAATADRPSERPQQLFFTGDQIYGDNVADPLLWAASDLCALLLGWSEQLPVREDRSSRQLEYRPISDFPFGNRAEVATVQAGFTAGLGHNSAKIASHLFSLGEYAAVYLLTWSPACWPQTFPTGKSITKNRRLARRWDAQVRQLTGFIAGLTAVRRALANIPLYTIFDDHEVSDDWNLNQEWCLRVLGKPLGRRVVQNALVAYAMFQGWGNTPDRFEPGTAGGKLLVTTQIWSASGGMDVAADAEIARLVGIPSPDPQTGLPKFMLDGEVAILDRDPTALNWNYTVSSNCHEVIFLDTRTWRGYHLDRATIAPPMLLSPTAFDRQLVQPLTAAPTDASRQTFIVAPTNLFGLAIIDWFHQCSLKHNQVFTADVGDSWNVHPPALAQLLTTLFTHRNTIIVLSGDIHHSSMVRLAAPHRLSSVLVQLTASSFKNEELKTKILHTHLKDWFFPEPIRRSILPGEAIANGWHRPPQMLPLPKLSQQSSPHDWEYALTWLPRNPARITKFQHQLPPPSHPWIQRLKWWNYRWLQDGREVVGLNNLAVVQWQSGSIVQDLYWMSPWLPNRIVTSRFIDTGEKRRRVCYYAA